LNGWAGQQSVTRELFIRSDGGLGSRPIPELASLEQSGGAKTWTQKAVGDTAFVLGHTTTARLRLTVDVPSATASSFSIRLFSSSAESVLVSYNFATRLLTLDTSNAGYGQTGQWQPVVVPGTDGKLSLDIFLDRSTLEIFSSDGVVTSARVYPRYQESQAITIEASGNMIFDSISLTPLGSSWC
jgi:sucrose-6-phosphate hydrolase SacC (GH32 family)